MTFRPHHAKYYAHDLTRRVASGMHRLRVETFFGANRGWKERVASSRSSSA